VTLDFFKNPIKSLKRTLKLFSPDIKQTKKKKKPDANRPILLVSNFATWKRPFFEEELDDYQFKYLSINKHVDDFDIDWDNQPPELVLIWGMRETEGLSKRADDYIVPVMRIEDGFVRSSGLGSQHVPSMSFCLDGKGLYFNAKQPSDLEDMLNTYDFEEDKDLLPKAKVCLDLLLKNKITKYNLPQTNRAEEIYGLKTKERILCIGQVEDDASILDGCANPITNNQLVIQAAMDHPTAQLIYKVHPDVLEKKRKNLSDPCDVAHLCTIINEQMSLDDALTSVDKVYTITSLAGFEARLRGVPVVTLGMPFYAGWGITEDRATCSRRVAKRSLLEVFCAAYILYPHYIHPENNTRIDLETAINFIAGDLNV